jgi:hypothetical protein
MNGNKESGLLAVNDIMKSDVGYTVNNSGKIIATITLIVAVITTVANIMFIGLEGEAFTLTLTVMLISSYVMYFSLEDAGEREGAETKEYTDAIEKFLSVKTDIHPEDIDELREFCLEYSESELIYRRKNYLCENGLTAADLESFKHGKKFPVKVSKILKRAARMKAINLTASRLLSTSQGVARSELSPPERNKMLSTVFSLVPSTLCTIFTVSIILTTKDELTASAVLDGIIKLSALPIIGFKGFLDGYRYSKESKSAWLETKCRILETFLLKKQKS